MGTRGRRAKKMTAAGQIFEDYGIVRGIYVGKMVNASIQLRNGTEAAAEALIDLEALDYNVHVPCDIVFSKGCYLTTAAAAPKLTIFYE